MASFDGGPMPSKPRPSPPVKSNTTQVMEPILLIQPGPVILAPKPRMNLTNIMQQLQDSPGGLKNGTRVIGRNVEQCNPEVNNCLRSDADKTDSPMMGALILRPPKNVTVPAGKPEKPRLSCNMAGRPPICYLTFPNGTSNQVPHRNFLKPDEEDDHSTDTPSRLGEFTEDELASLSSEQAATATKSSATPTRTRISRITNCAMPTCTHPLLIPSIPQPTGSKPVQGANITWTMDDSNIENSIAYMHPHDPTGTPVMLTNRTNTMLTITRKTFPTGRSVPTRGLYARDMETRPSAAEDSYLWKVGGVGAAVGAGLLLFIIGLIWMFVLVLRKKGSSEKKDTESANGAKDLQSRSSTWFGQLDGGNKAKSKKVRDFLDDPEARRMQQIELKRRAAQREWVGTIDRN